MLTINQNIDQNYVEVILEGRITYETFEEMINSLNELYPNGKLKILQSYKNASFDINYKEVTKLAKLTKQLLDPYDMVKTASVIETAKEMALNMLYGSLIFSQKFKQKNFSSKENALLWLLG